MRCFWMVLYSYPSVLLCLSLCFFLGLAKEVVKRNLALTPSFRRRGVASSTPAAVSTTMSVLPSALSRVDDDEVSPRGTDLRPRKRRAVDGGAGVPVVVNLSEVSSEVEVQDVVTTSAEGDVGAAPEVPWLEEADIAASLRSEGDEATMNAFYEDPALPRREEAPPTELAHAVSPADKGKGKLLAEQCDEQAEPIGDEFDSDFDPEEHEMIDSGTTHIKVRAEGGSRNITIPVNHDLLKNTEDVIQAFGPFCSDAKHQTLGELSGSTLSKSIVGLTLRVSHLSTRS
uniref:Uncharacterized protein LOC104236526 n=1 Tax=Nicotiana sylvestris TaxID=4096 RepID=A0A1U7XP92_NICSY|nr:PREDICTED: uncharacterized protein LOC104236526 [Nicotiana sylvestris]